jgi:hypothetical protein
MKTTSILLATAITILAACSGDPSAGSTSGGTRIVMSADVQKEGVQYFEVTHPSSAEEVVTAFDARNAVVFSIDYVSNDARTQRTITVSGVHVSRTRTIPETPVTASSAATLRPQEKSECDLYYREMVASYDARDWADFDFWADSIIAFC